MYGHVSWTSTTASVDLEALFSSASQESTHSRCCPRAVSLQHALSERPTFSSSENACPDVSEKILRVHRCPPHSFCPWRGMRVPFWTRRCGQLRQFPLAAHARHDEVAQRRQASPSTGVCLS